MSLSIYTSDKLPKIPNDGYCHAILEDGLRCGLKTERYKKEGQWAYAKWCPRHNTDCKRYYETYKDSCIGFKNFKCSKTEGTRTSETAKKYRIKECINDRHFFESKCYHESKRDRGHLLFLETLHLMLDECSDIINELPIEEVKKSTAYSSPTEESLASKISKLSLNLETEEERKRRLQSKKEKTLENKKLQRSIQKQKEKERKELERLEKESLKQKEKENEEKLNEIFEQINDPKNKPLILEKQNLLINEISGLIDDEMDIERTFKSMKKRKSSEPKGSDKIYDRAIQEYNILLEMLTEIKPYYPKFKEIKTRSIDTVLPLKDVQLLQDFLKKLQQFNELKKTIDNRILEYKSKLAKETFEEYKTKLDQIKNADQLLKSDILDNLRMKQKNMSAKDYEGKIRIINLVFDEWERKNQDLLDKLNQLQNGSIKIQEFLESYYEFFTWRAKKFENVMSLTEKWGI